MDSTTTFQVMGLLLFSPVAFAVLPNGECSASGLTCGLENNNVVGIIFDVSSKDECQKDCEDISTGCRTFSYFGPGTNCIKIGLPGKLILSKRKGLWEVIFS